jgi:mRNA interferase RelE/StbE
MFRALLHKKIEKFLDSKDDKFVLLFRDKVRILKKNPFERNTNVDVVPLKGKKNHYRLRVGKYRFLYEVKKHEILIYFYKVDKRGDIY